MGMGMGMGMGTAAITAAFAAMNWFVSAVERCRGVVPTSFSRSNELVVAATEGCRGVVPTSFSRTTNPLQQPAVSQPRVLDNFDKLAGWGTFPSDGVTLRLSSVKGA